MTAMATSKKSTRSETLPGAGLPLRKRQPRPTTRKICQLWSLTPRPETVRPIRTAVRFRLTCQPSWRTPHRAMWSAKRRTPTRMSRVQTVLVAVQRTGTSGFTWQAVYDGFGRRLQTTTTASGSGTTVLAQSSYDPEVQFLELATTINGQREWLVHGPDLTGGYGDLQGTGGIDAVVNPSASTATGIISDVYGHVEATVSGTSVTWNPVLCVGYGAEPGLNAEPLDGTHDLSTFLAWRSKYIDPSGFYYLGNRYYDPQSGTFLSPDPLGHAASMDLYQAFNGDPVNYFDPRGLIASNFLNGANDNPNSPENQAYAENSLATDASLPPSFYRGLANFANHTLQGLINLPGALFQVGSSSLNFTGTVVTDPAAAWNQTQQTIAQIPQSVLNGVDGIRIASETPEGRDELLIGSAFFATPLAESDFATAAAATESVPSAIEPSAQLAAESGGAQIGFVYGSGTETDPIAIEVGIIVSEGTSQGFSS